MHFRHFRNETAKRQAGCENMSRLGNGSISWGLLLSALRAGSFDSVQDGQPGTICGGSLISNAMGPIARMPQKSCSSCEPI